MDFVAYRKSVVITGPTRFIVEDGGLRGTDER
jgi:hypothetical protein